MGGWVGVGGRAGDRRGGGLKHKWRVVLQGLIMRAAGADFQDFVPAFGANGSMAEVEIEGGAVVC